MKGIIYKFTSPSGKVYIGQTTSKYRRMQHKQEAYFQNNQKPFYKAIRKYGFENFTYEVLEEVFGNTLEEVNNRLDELEIYYISLYKSTDGRFGYNLCNGGRTNRGYHHSEEYKQHLSKKQKGKKMPPGCVEKAAQNRIGKPMNKIAYKKLQIINKKRAKKVGLYDLKGKLLRTFNSITEISAFLACRRSNIQNAINKNFTVYKKYKIKILKDMTTITVKQMAAIKRVAMNVLPLVTKKAKVAQKIIELGEEHKKLQEQIDVQQGYVKSFAGGLTTEQLVVRRDGKFEPNLDVVTFDEEKRVYVVKEASEEEAAEVHAAQQAAEAEAEAEAAAEQQNNEDPDPFGE